jgi:hypothetical protein
VEGIWKACAERVSQPFLKKTKLEPSAMQTKAGLMGAISLVPARNSLTSAISTPQAASLQLAVEGDG